MAADIDLQFFTVVARNYLAYAFVLGKSLQEQHPDGAFSIFVMDDPDHEFQAMVESRGFRAIYPEDIPLKEYRKFVFQYNITEASTGVKPFVFQALFDRGADKVVYLDPDILCLSPLDDVLNALCSFSIVVTPHICSPVPNERFPDDREFLGAGVYNLGFIALRRSVTTDQFLRWWASHLERECILERDAGLFVDQKWIDLVPACFDSVFILRNLGYNVAYWNLQERIVAQRDGAYFVRDSGQRVAFVHFSGFDMDNPDGISKYRVKNPFSPAKGKVRYSLTDRPDLKPLFYMYRDLLLANECTRFATIPYGYGSYENEEAISALERAIYLHNEHWHGCERDPFTVGHGSFHEACRRSGLRAQPRIAMPRFSERRSSYARMIELVLRACQRGLGANRYLAFAKYIRHQLLPQNQGFLLKRARDSADKSKVDVREPVVIGDRVADTDACPR